MLPNGKYAFGVHRTEGETGCQAARRDTVTGEFAELTPSKDGPALTGTALRPSAT